VLQQLQLQHHRRADAEVALYYRRMPHVSRYALRRRSHHFTVYHATIPLVFDCR
jgi:hypothetical protein